MSVDKPLSTEQQQAAERILNTWLKKKQLLGLTQERAAEKAGWSQGMFNHYIHGRKALNIEAVLLFAGILDEDPMQLAPEILEPVSGVFGHGDSVREERGGYSTLTNDERNLLEKYRGLSAKRRHAIVTIIDEMLER